MIDQISLFWRGLLIGLAIAAPVGPIGVLCIRRTLAFGRAAGFVSGLGAATADAFYGIVAGFGLVMLSNFIIEQGSWLRLFGGMFLIYLGVKTFLTHSGMLTGNEKREGLFGLYVSTFFLTITNPVTILFFAAIFAGLGLSSENELDNAALLVAGVFSGSVLWWFFLSGMVSLFRERLKLPGLVWVNRLSGGILIAFGLGAFLSSMGQNGAVLPGVGEKPEETISAVLIEGFDRADGVRPFLFPQDHGPHPDFQTEWWYYTGNLQSAEGERFGYQLTFFRRALLPPASRIERPSEWATQQVYMVHFAVTDVKNNRHEAFEALERGSAGISGAASPPFRVWLDDYQVEAIGDNLYQVNGRAVTEDGLEIILDLELRDVQGPTLQGDQGYSRKGADPGNASYYYSLARLDTQGSLQIGTQLYIVKGSSWMDHEFSTSALTTDKIGWDWFSVQMEDGSELMFFQIRTAGGMIDPFSSGTYIAPNGSIILLTKDDFEIQVMDSWISPRTGAAYPAHWQVELRGLDISLEIIPVISDQELNVSYSYWEGAVNVLGNYSGQLVNGVGYIELTGYAGSMAGEF